MSPSDGPQVSAGEIADYLDQLRLATTVSAQPVEVATTISV
jgi:hypothetical protein